MSNPTAPGIASTAPPAGSCPAPSKTSVARFADYVVADGEFARAPFLHDAGDLGLSVIIRLKNNLPELFAAAQKRFRGQPPHQVFSAGPRIGWRSGMPTTLTLGIRCGGKPCG